MKQAHQALANGCSGGQKQFILNNRPNMMSAIAAGTQIFFASSA
jgi:hypothetical protein